MIAHPIDEESALNAIRNVLGKVSKELIDNDTGVSIEELLNSAGVNVKDYENALRTSSKGNAVVLKRNPKECKINN